MATAAPQTAMDMPQGAAPNPFSDPKTTQVYDQMRQSVSPKQFGDEILAGASQVDPEEVTKFRSALEKLEVPMEVLDMLNNMVDEILANPDNYAQVKQKYEAMGVTEDLLPAEFDGYFFSALNMAVDQMIAEPAGAQAFAKGGIAELSPISKAVANYGRNGDTMLAHITPAEARMLRRRGGAGTTNPNTGLKEYFSLGGLFKSIGNAVKDFASSSVGRLVTGVALGFFLGPAAIAAFGATAGTVAAAAITGFTASAGSSLLAGDGISTALRQGVVGAVTAGAVQGVGSAVSPGFSLTGQAPVDGVNPTAMDALKGQYNKVFDPSATASGVQAPAIDASGQVAGLAPTEPVYQGGQNLPQAESFPVGDSINPATPPTNTGSALPASPPPPVMAAPSTPVYEPYDPATATRASDYGYKPGGGVGTKVPTIGESFSKMGEGLGMGDKAASFDTFKQGATDLFSPSLTNEQLKLTPEYADAMSKGKTITEAMGEAAKANAPGFLRTYGPAAAVGIGTLAATGGFKPTAAAESTLKPELMKPVTQRIAEQGNQRNYYLQNLPGVKYDQYGAPIFGQSNPFPMYDTGLGIASLDPKGYAVGGEVTMDNFNEQAYLQTYPEVAALIADGQYPNGAAHYFQVGRYEGKKGTITGATTGTTGTTTTDTAKEAAQAANQKLVADAEAARKAAGYGSAYQNINAGLSYDAPAGYAAPAIAAREAAFKPTMDKFTNAQAANAATLAKPYTPTVVAQPYNNTNGYTNVFNPVAPPVNYDTTPEFTAAQRVAIQNMPKDVSKLTAMDKAGIYVNLANNKLSDQQIRNAAEAAYGAQTTSDWKGLQDAVGQYQQAGSIGLRLPSDWTSKNAAQKIDYFNTQGTDAAALAKAGIGADDITWMQANGLKAPASATKLMNMGGIASLGSGGYPRRTGKISGPGTATSDSIPAMLSDGEFVMTAKAVRGAGKGDKRAGAKRMYALMNQLEKNAARG